MQNIIKKYSPDLYVGASILSFVQGIYNWNTSVQCSGIDCFYAPIAGKMMVKNVRINLSDLFDDLFMRPERLWR